MSVTKIESRQEELNKNSNGTNQNSNSIKNSSTTTKRKVDFFMQPKLFKISNKKIHQKCLDWTNYRFSFDDK